MTIDDSVLAALHAELDRLMTENIRLREQVELLTEHAARAEDRISRSCVILERLLAMPSQS